MTALKISNVPTTGTDLYQRVYWCTPQEARNFGRMHAWQDTGDRENGTQNVYFGQNGCTATGCSFYMGEIGTVNDGTYGFDDGGSNMDCTSQTERPHGCYRVELHTEFVDRGTPGTGNTDGLVQHHIRIFDTDGTLQMDDEDFLCDDGITLDAHYQAGDLLAWDGQSSWIALQQNDTNDFDSLLPAFCVTDFAIATDDWVGPAQGLW